MSFQSDLADAETRRQTDYKNTSLTTLEADIRYHRRRLAAEINNPGNLSGAREALTELGLHAGDVGHIDEAGFNSNKATVAAAIATLVADGASPTQAHVTAANNAHTVFKGHLTFRKFTAADKSSFESALATLVADGASPTQAHVTTLNSVWSTFLSGLV